MKIFSVSILFLRPPILLKALFLLNAEDSPEKVLNWSDRLAVLIGVAKAVHFLHTGIIPSCFNNRLKTNNILLDEHQIAKLSDYGMSILTDDIDKSEVTFFGQLCTNS